MYISIDLEWSKTWDFDLKKYKVWKKLERNPSDKIKVFNAFPILNTFAHTKGNSMKDLDLNKIHPPPPPHSSASHF